MGTWASDWTQKVQQFVVDTCGCKWPNGKPCNRLFTEEYYVTYRAQASFVMHEQLDFVLLVSVMSTVSDGDVVATRHKPAKRQRAALTYMCKSHHLCMSTFNCLYGVSKHGVPAIKRISLSMVLKLGCMETQGSAHTMHYPGIWW